MKFNYEFCYKGDRYTILHYENDTLLTSEFYNSFEDLILFEIEDYHLIYHSQNDLKIGLTYSGGIIIARDFVESYGNFEEYPCYCYKRVFELIFEDGRLVTSIDHSKAMTRIRKNIEKGLRDIRSKKDYKCIQRFIKESFVKNYHNPIIKKYWNQLVENLRI